MPDVTTQEHEQAAQLIGRLIASYNEVEDLLNIGAYAQGSNPDYDLAITARPMIEQLLRQGRNEGPDQAQMATIQQQLHAIVLSIQQAQPQQPNHGS